ncbi:DUF1428 domain-containing protein [Marinobacter sp. NFXS9]|uniref:DUF1428 domain-containing protein n=1 Tax=Marinobacter sp. NFXS9 TaxID=2818433 RepID=UPI0032DF8A00
MAYVDGFVVPVPKANKEAYLKMAREAAAIFRDHGALQLVECWGDDVPEGKLTSFPMAVQCKADEVVVFSWILWPSKAVRDTGLKQAMEDPRMNMDMSKMPFDGKRMIFGGFEQVVDA